MGAFVIKELFLATVIASLSSVAMAQEESLRRQKRSVEAHETARESVEPSGGGQTYIRWGRTTCPNYPDTHRVYKGLAGGPWYQHKGGGANLLCLSDDPVWGTYDEKLTGHVNLHGVEYQTGWPLENDNIEEASHVNQDVPCAVCWALHRTTLMIPGRRTCVPGWRLEYHGYLMAEHHTHNRGEFICVDHAPEADPGGSERKLGALLYYVEAYCAYALRCPPYVNGREITCVVCSR